jgi:SAM-dependent methyltransferase
MTESPASRDDRAHWNARYEERGPELDRAPSSWVIEQCQALSPTATIVDLAGGTGRHAEALARSGWRVTVVDFVPGAVAAAVARHDRVEGLVADARRLPLRDRSIDAIVCVSFLDRSIFPSLAAALRPGGILVYETFTLAHLDVVARGRARGPRNAAYLLGAGELPRLVAPLEVQVHDERLVVDGAGERHVARVMAVKR